MSITPRLLLLAGAFILGLFGAAPAAGVAARGDSDVTLGRRLPAIAANDNTVAGGRLRGGILHLDLEARRGLWYPDGPRTSGLPIEAFGEAGKPLQIPGPLVRVTVGTKIVATIHNALGHELTVRGLAAPDAAATTLIHVAAGATRHVSFILDRPGAFGYYGSDDKGANANNPSETIDTRIFRDAELSGAIVVEKPGAPRVDHVFVLGVYDAVKLRDGTPNFLYLLETINGRAFPATEQLTYARGKTVHWAVYNASSMTHPMHLHGFYFRLDRPTPYDEVTHAFHPGEAGELTWTADRSGDWMFHCHIDDHIARHPPIHEMLTHRSLATRAELSRAAVARRFHLPNTPMGGMVIALHVTPRRGDHVPVASKASRRLALVVDAVDDEQPPYPGLSKDVVHVTDGSIRSASTGNLAPPIVLTRGEPVAIDIRNHTHEQTSIHWHGIALADSYYDGGAGMGAHMTMNGGRTSPPIDPGASFVARFTPPDAGTFMYHTHMDDGWQLAGGLDGALIVLPPKTRFDPATDHLVMITESYEKSGEPYVAIGGQLKPPPMTMTAGVEQRLRVGLLTLGGQDCVVSLVDADRVVHWTPLAKDGRDLPAALQQSELATQAMTIGETRDFRFVPTHPGRFELRVYDRNNDNMVVAAQTIDVAAP